MAWKKRQDHTLQVQSDVTITVGSLNQEDIFGTFRNTAGHACQLLRSFVIFNRVSFKIALPGQIVTGRLYHDIFVRNVFCLNIISQGYHRFYKGCISNNFHHCMRFGEYFQFLDGIVFCLEVKVKELEAKK